MNNDDKDFIWQLVGAVIIIILIGVIFSNPVEGPCSDADAVQMGGC